MIRPWRVGPLYRSPDTSRVGVWIDRWSVHKDVGCGAVGLARNGRLEQRISEDLQVAHVRHLRTGKYPS